MGRFFDWLFRRETYNYGTTDSANAFYLAPRSVWRQVKNVRDVCVSFLSIGDENREQATGKNLGELFFNSLPILDHLSMPEAAEKTIILRIDRISHPNDPGKVEFVFFYVC